MGQNDELLSKIDDIEKQLDEKAAKRFNLNRLRRIAKRLIEFRSDCCACDEWYTKLQEHVDKLSERKSALLHQDYKQHQRLVQAVVVHMQKKHGLVEEGYYAGALMSLGLSIGSGLGIVFGLTLMDNMAIGLPIGFGLGISLGLSLGAAKDAQVKKNGFVI